jgi:hypothetical protein
MLYNLMRVGGGLKRSVSAVAGESDPVDLGGDVEALDFEASHLGGVVVDRKDCRTVTRPRPVDYAPPFWRRKCR